MAPNAGACSGRQQALFNLGRTAPAGAARQITHNDYLVLDYDGSVRLAPPHSRWDRANRDAVSDI
jgi:hypothetical protein